MNIYLSSMFNNCLSLQPVNNEQIVYADLEFISGKDENKQHKKKWKEEDETLYAEIDFSK